MTRSIERVTLINTSFKGQRITGQQRYATEVAARLLERDDFAELSPSRWVTRSALRAWAWVFSILELRSRGRVLLSLTSRAALFHRRQVLVVHDLFVLTNPEWFSRRYVLSHAGLLRSQLRRAVAVVAVSQPVADQVAEVFDGPIVVAPNAPSEVFSERGESSGVLDGDRRGETDAALMSRGLHPDRYLLAVGSMDPRKNLPVLATAYGALTIAERSELPLVVVGGGAAIYRDEKIAWPHGVVDAGYVTDEDLRSLYAGARAVVFPSLAEGFGLPLVEAAAAGTRALVVSDIPVFRWVCGEGATYFDPTSPSDLTAALRTVIDSPVGIDIDLDRFDWDESARIVGDLCAGIRGEVSVPEEARHG